MKRNLLNEGDWVLYQGQRYQVIEIRRDTLLFESVCLAKPGHPGGVWVHSYKVELVKDKGGAIVSTVYEESGIFTEGFIDLHDRLQKAVAAIVETEVKPFITAQKSTCMDIRLINAEWRDLIDLHMDSLWLDCLGDLGSQEGQS